MFRRTVLENPWVRQKPKGLLKGEWKENKKQAEFLWHVDTPEILFGGGAGGGKSNALLGAAAQFVEDPQYAALILRRTYPELSKPGALISKSLEWWKDFEVDGKKAIWNGSDHSWHFPSGAVIQFGYLENENDKYQYQSSEFTFCAFDELTAFSETQYTYLFSRLRRHEGSQTPIRMRAASNPGNVGMKWVRDRWTIGQGDKDPTQRRFIKSLLDDNPFLDKVAYLASLANLPMADRKQLESGDWSDFEGKLFHPKGWPRFIDLGDAFKCAGQLCYANEACVFIAVDPAATVKKNSDCTAFVVGALTPWGDLLVLHVVNAKFPLKDLVPELAKLCRRWRPTLVGIEALGFQQGIVDACRAFPDIPAVWPLQPKGQQKRKRWLPAVALGETSRIWLPQGDYAWMEDFTSQLAAAEGVSEKERNDMADALSYLVEMSTLMGNGLGPQEMPYGVLVPGKQPV